MTPQNAIAPCVLDQDSVEDIDSGWTSAPFYVGDASKVMLEFELTIDGDHATSGVLVGPTVDGPFAVLDGSAKSISAAAGTSGYVLSPPSNFVCLVINHAATQVDVDSLILSKLE